ncbi:MAG: formate dehydrogenase accessory sulfurtransferase FdhD [Angelakisella sp.]
MEKECFRIPAGLQELPVRLIVNDELFAEFICTPAELSDLVAGLLLSGGKISSIHDICSFEFVEPCSEIRVSTANPLFFGGESFTKLVVEALAEDFPSNTTASSNSLPCDIMDKLSMLGKRMEELRSPGLHGAMLWSNDRTLFRQDISRHCAVDKVIGGGIKLGMVTASSTLLTTGRISSELLWKARMLHIPVIASIKYPSRTGELVASAWGITLACNILSQEARLLLPKCTEGCF